jgi:hypothetical protein
VLVGVENGLRGPLKTPAAGVLERAAAKTLVERRVFVVGFVIVVLPPLIEGLVNVQVVLVGEEVDAIRVVPVVEDAVALLVLDLVSPPQLIDFGTQDALDIRLWKRSSSSVMGTCGIERRPSASSNL